MSPVWRRVAARPLPEAGVSRPCGPGRRRLPEGGEDDAPAGHRKDDAIAGNRKARPPDGYIREVHLS